MMFFIFSLTLLQSVNSLFFLSNVKTWDGKRLFNFLNPKPLIFQNKYFKMTFDNLHVYEKLPELGYFTVNLEEKYVKMSIFNELVEYIGHYNINGSFDSREIYGQGLGNATWVNNTINLEANFTIDRKGLNFYNISFDDLSMKPKDFSFRFENLYNGDSERGEKMNKYIAENWKSFLEPLKPAFIEQIKEEFLHILNLMGKSLVPFNFLIKPLLCKFTLYC